MYIENLPKEDLYCLGRTIAIEDEPETDCPAYPITLPASTKWKTSDKTFSGLPKTSLSFSVVNKLPENIVPSQIQDPNSTKFVETIAFRKIQNLTALMEIERKSSLALNTSWWRIFCRFEQDFTLQRRSPHMCAFLVLETQPPNH